MVEVGRWLMTTKNLMIEICNTCACVGTLTCVEPTEDIVVWGISYVILGGCIHEGLFVKVDMG